MDDTKDSSKVFAKMAVGLWQYSRKVDDLTDTDADGDAVKRASQGIYAMGEQALDKHDGGRRTMGYVRYGVANKDGNRLQDAVGMGVTFEGPCSACPDDVLGFASAHARARRSTTCKLPPMNPLSRAKPSSS